MKTHGKVLVLSNTITDTWMEDNWMDDNTSESANNGVWNQIRNTPAQNWTCVTREHLDSLESYYGGSDSEKKIKSREDEIYDAVIAEKNRVMERYDREEAGVDRYGNRLYTGKRRAVTNYTKPKKRKKKK